MPTPKILKAEDIIMSRPFFFLESVNFFNTKTLHYLQKLPFLLAMLIVDIKSGRFMYQSRRVGDEAKKLKSPAKSGRVGISAFNLV